MKSLEYVSRFFAMGLWVCWYAIRYAFGRISVLARVRDTELQLARQLIEQSGVERFDPSGLKDEVKARIEAAIEKKVAGQQITVAEVPPEGGAQIIDLMEALRASLQGSAGSKRAAEAATPEPAAGRKPARRAPRAAAPEAAPKRASRRK